MSTLFHNATFYPMTSEGARAEAIAVDDDGIISFVGSLEETRSRTPDADEIDLGGAHVLPGFIDPHSHFVGAMQYVLYADLSTCASFSDIQRVIRDFIDERNVGPDGVVMATGYDQNALAEGRHPDKTVLDEVSTSIPIMAVHASNHMAVANSPLLRLAGIDESTPDPEGGHFGRVGDTLEPDGYAEEPAAMNALYAVTTPRIAFDPNAIADDMQLVYLEHGVTTCQDGATPANMVDMLRALADNGKLKIDVVAYPMHGEDVDAILEKHADLDGLDYHGHLRIGGLKMFLDGSPQGLTAWMTEPYSAGPKGEDDWVAYGTMTDEDAAAFARKAIDSGHQLLCHANGDAASDQLLRVYATALDASDNPRKRELRPVMIHCQTARADQYDRMAELGMIPSIFSSHIWYWGDVHLRNFGPNRGGRISACGDAKRAGLPFTLHTDTPVLRPNLIEAAWCAVNRVTKNGVQLDEEQKVSVYDALRAITANAAYQYGEEDRKGTLEPGKLADFAVLDRDPFAIDPADLRNVAVLATIKEGKEVYRK
ncbi:hypothetical protein B5F40_12440 [Gordonibacter sp. An230]|uniref:amidohydrolase n=1 Tax=Gordonibacter sp. An230 TaxID=1965592 RepID=UPI000B3A10CF|nr:amidohydrolase [Gordonibacter sp. An230]OUO88340.1 hypothetical protein B5F40_12440 [Gordonibacter sp. An230]